ncbi:baeRF10 domain-containing protein [Aeoliella sp. SH292]|uniref:baeRF10 domain-containing protein n=1 Tax=Aeoliella sp. SH292 TaxID=3454464 RepID=UPI003F9D14A0
MAAIQQIDLRRLAELRGNGRDFLSVYFTGREGFESLAARERSLREVLADNDTELELFDANIAMVREVLDGQSLEDVEGVCLFACALMDFVEGHFVALPVPTAMHVGPSPYIRPLAELQDEYETFALVACDNKKTRIFTVTDAKSELESTIRGDVKNHVRKGGWSQQRYERRRDNQLLHYADEVCESLESLCKDESVVRIILAGSAETIRQIDERLPESLRGLVVARDAFDLNRNEDELITQAYEQFFADEREDEGNLWQQIKDEYMANGRGTVGATRVLDAARAGRMETMLVARDAKVTGTHCRDCDHVVHGTPQTCQQCGSKSLFEVDLVDTLTRLVELSSGSVNYADPLPGLEKSGHVAALLRY